MFYMLHKYIRYSRITQSVFINGQHILLSLQVFDFELSKEEMNTIMSFNRNWRAFTLEW